MCFTDTHAYFILFVIGIIGLIFILTIITHNLDRLYLSGYISSTRVLFHIRNCLHCYVVLPLIVILGFSFSPVLLFSPLKGEVSINSNNFMDRLNFNQQGRNDRNTVQLQFTPYRDNELSTYS
jgi:hypothetical protein